MFNNINTNNTANEDKKINYYKAMMTLFDFLIYIKKR